MSISSVTEAEVGKAAGSNNLLQELGGAFGVAAAVAVFTGVCGYGAPGDFADGLKCRARSVRRTGRPRIRDVPGPAEACGCQRSLSVLETCRRGDLNPHALIGHQALNLARLPIPPLRRGRPGLRAGGTL